VGRLAAGGRGLRCRRARTLSAGDYTEVLALWQRSPGVGLDESDTREAVAAFLDRNPDMSFVAVSGGEIVGAVLCGHDGRRGYLHHLAVDAPHRGRGIARELVARCEQTLVERGIQKCNVFLFADTESGAAFWRRHGFEPRTDLAMHPRRLLP
jgi:ribosomal protein S18 acetylase RimI-like enzyme